MTRSVRQLLYLSQDAVFDASRALLVSTDSYVLDSPLGPGDSYTDSEVVATPPGSSGQWYAHVFTNVSTRRRVPQLTEWSASGFPSWVDHFADKVWEGDDGRLNNSGSSEAIDVQYAEANLVISGLSAVPVDPNSGSVLNVSFTVTNGGTRQTRVNSWTDRVFISTDTSLDSFDKFLGNERRSAPLGIGESYDVSLQVRVPDNIGGPFHIIAATDAVLRPWIPGSNARPLPYPSIDGARQLHGSKDTVEEFRRRG